MNLLTILLQQQGGGMSMIIMMVAIFAIMYFFMIRPQNKKQKEIANFRKSLQVNQSVITAGGIHGTIKEITDDYIVLEIASNVKIKIDKNSIFADASADGPVLRAPGQCGGPAPGERQGGPADGL